MGEFLRSTAAFFASVLAAIITLMIAVYTRGKYYVKEEANDIPKEDYIRQEDHSATFGLDGLLKLPQVDRFFKRKTEMITQSPHNSK